MWVCGRQRSTETGFSPSASGSPCQYQPVNVSLIHSSITDATQGAVSIFKQHNLKNVTEENVWTTFICGLII